MKVFVYVEGPADKLAMEALLSALIAEKQSRGIAINFFPTPTGHNKESIVDRLPKRAIDILRNDQDAIVAAIPDLHPFNVGFPHQTPTELAQGLMQQFRDAAHEKQIDDERILSRFRAFCFKHDLEALILANESSLRTRLGAAKFAVDWVRPVEDQNDQRFPKAVVEDLFKAHKQKYRAVVDAPQILAMSNYADIADACPQCFKPFVDFLEDL
jgi:hypothetical protein